RIEPFAKSGFLARGAPAFHKGSMRATAPCRGDSGGGLRYDAPHLTWGVHTRVSQEAVRTAPWARKRGRGPGKPRGKSQEERTPCGICCPRRIAFHIIPA